MSGRIDFKKHKQGRCMMLTLNPSSGTRFSLRLLTAIIFSLVSIAGFAQSTISTGTVVGTVTDPQGAVVDGARISITNVATGQTVSVTSNGTGAFNAGSLIPG